MALRLSAWNALPLWIAMAAGLAGLGAVLLSELWVKRLPDPVPSTRSDSDLLLTGFRMVTTVNGVTEWELTASRARLFEERHQAVLEDVQGATRSPDGLAVRFEGAEGSYDIRTQDFTIEGPGLGTVVRLSNGYVIHADDLHWNQGSREMASDHPVSITGPRIALTGAGLRVQPDSQELTLLRDVRADVF